MKPILILLAAALTGVVVNHALQRKPPAPIAPSATKPLSPRAKFLLEEATKAQSHATEFINSTNPAPTQP